MIAKINARLRLIPVWAVWLAGMLPLVLLVVDTLNGALGVEPVRDIEHRLGRTALYFLVASLAVTPLLRMTRVNLMRFRRALGLLCFSYAVLHVLAWVVMDMGLLWSQILRDLVKRPYLFFGMGCLALLIILAATSNDLSIRRLGGAAWRRIHRLVYVAAPLAALHWIWALKIPSRDSVFWLVAILFLLLLRLVRLRAPLSAGRKKSDKISL